MPRLTAKRTANSEQQNEAKSKAKAEIETETASEKKSKAAKEAQVQFALYVHVSQFTVHALFSLHRYPLTVTRFRIRIRVQSAACALDVLPPKMCLSAGGAGRAEISAKANNKLPQRQSCSNVT